jgi:release factor glutamine methyltransferase
MQVAKKFISDQLSPIYPKEEIAGLTKLIFEKVLKLSGIQLHLQKDDVISAANLAEIKDIVNQLAQFKPIQYILGESHFYGLTFKVTESVLIPRSETEELVDWIIQDYTELAPKILDIGTGSGCIPISLLLHIPKASAEAWDISEKALVVANENAINNKTEVNFRHIDLFKASEEPSKYDVIVSNPPYVTEPEKELMHQNVLDYEPHNALFVPDQDPLLFYAKIAELALIDLKPDGHLYFEINEQFGQETLALLSSKGYINLVLKKDLNGKDRMIKAQRPL